MKPSIKILPPSRLAAVLVAVVTATAVNAQTTLQPQIVLRPLTSVDVSTYGLPSSTEISGGLSTIGIGTPAYLEVEVSSGFPASNIVSVAWAITSKPAGSVAALQASPLGANVPIYEPSDRLIDQVPQPGGRTVLRPDMVGQYVVTATITTTSGVTNVTQTITAGTYMGVATCELCHSGGQIAENKWTTWSQTLHAQVFAHEIDGIDEFSGTPMRQSCLQCHTTGYDALGTNAPDGGFNDLAQIHGWSIPAVLTNGNWVSMQTNYPQVAALANVQCESCHGPGSQHVGLLGNTNSPAWPAVAVDYSSGDCQQCHDDAVHHPYGTEWLNSVHAVTTRDPAGNASCVGCHTAYGFIGRIEGWTTTNTTYAPINCQTCHEPHGETIPANNPHLIRTLAAVTLMDGTVVTNAGEGALCMECHHARQNAAVYAATTKGSTYFGPHEGPQADMLEGVNGFTYGQTIPSSAHANAVSNTCVTCHMQNIASTDLAFTHAGGHTFNMTYNGEDLVAACQQCHGPTLTSFDFSLQDYNGDGVIQGVQDEVQGLLNKLSTLLPPDNSVKTSLSINSTWTQPQLEAAYNWLFVDKDGSLGIHNTAYAVGLLKASIANLTGDANNDGLPDSWQTNYFGSINNPLAAPNAVNNTNGVPNWMMYALGLNPAQSGITVPGGVVWMDGAKLVNSGATNTVHIYTAAEVSFNTVSGDTYQIQGISNLSGGWQNIGNPILGTGQPVSYLTPTRNNAQMFFRVITDP
jgi:Cytochrome c554 and c-prime